jgi:hypothetical protein
LEHHAPPDGGRPQIEVRFGLDIPRTVVTASTGAKLAELHGGSWAGEAFAHVIGFFVARPVRPMAFARMVTLGGLSFDRALVRGSDFRGRNALPTDPPADPSEIVVRGDAGKTRAVYNALLGQDLLSRCSSISYATQSRVLTLRCLARDPS